MPKAWTEKDERQYEHVKESERVRSKDELSNRAAELGIDRRSGMSKAELIDAIRAQQ